jgi:hypothetical protein
MANKPRTVVEVEVLETFNSLSHMASNQAKLDDVLKNHAQYAIDNIVGFPESEPSTEQKEELNKGYISNFKIKNPDITYYRVDGNLFPESDLNPEQLKGLKEKIIIGVDYVEALGQQKWTALNTDKEGGDKALHAVIGKLRKKMSNYRTEKYRSLVIKAKQLKKELSPKTGTKNPVVAFDSRIKNAFDALEKQVKLAVARQDATADPELFKKAKIAFNAIWNHQK